MTKIFLFLFTIISLTSYCQVNNLDIRFSDVSWINDVKTAEIVSTLSAYYGDSSLINDSLFVGKERYELYYDSLSLWRVTNKKNSWSENANNSESGILGDFNAGGVDLTVKDRIGGFRTSFYTQYSENNSTKGINTIPCDIETLNYFYKEESKNITEYNNGRIKRYSYTLVNKDKDPKYSYTVKFSLYLHKSILPEQIYSVQLGLINPWIPYFYRYQKPKVKVYESNVCKMWTSKTGLDCSVIDSLNLDSSRVEWIVYHLTKPNPNLLIPQKTLTKMC